MNQIEDIKPMVSVVMITYNHEAFIAEAIEGVLMQVADFPIEFIIADDCSPDRTNEIVQNYINNHPNGKWITYTRHPNNKGMMPNFIWALEQAKGKYIALCEGDDYWTDPLKLQKQVDFLEENEEYVVSGHNATIITNDGSVLKEKIPLTSAKDATKKELKRVFFIATLTMMFRNIKCTIYELKSAGEILNADSYLTSLLGNHGGYHFHHNIKNSIYRLHNGGVWSSISSLQKLKQQKLTFDRLSKMYHEKSEFEDAKYLKRLSALNSEKIYLINIGEATFTTKIYSYLRLAQFDSKYRNFNFFKHLIKNLLK